MRPERAAALLVVLGLAQMVGDLASVPALEGVAAATGASPAPKAFSAVSQAAGAEPLVLELDPLPGTEMGELATRLSISCVTGQVTTP